MDCSIRIRRDDIPKKTRKEKSWYCHACGVLLFDEKRPVCQRAMLEQLKAARAAAETETQRLHLNDKDKR